MRRAAAKRAVDHLPNPLGEDVKNVVNTFLLLFPGKVAISFAQIVSANIRLNFIQKKTVKAQIANTTVGLVGGASGKCLQLHPNSIL